MSIRISLVLVIVVVVVAAVVVVVVVVPGYGPHRVVCRYGENEIDGNHRPEYILLAQ